MLTCVVATPVPDAVTTIVCDPVGALVPTAMPRVTLFPVVLVGVRVRLTPDGAPVALRFTVPA
jgi:hypothetical protein